MADIGALSGLIELNDKFTPKIREAISHVGDLEENVNKLSAPIDRLTSKMKSAGLKVSVGLTLPIVGVAATLLKFGSDAVESENLVSESFKEMTDSATRWSKELSDKLGLNEFNLRKQGASFFLLASNMGQTRKSALDISKTLVELSTDLTSFLNIPTAQATRALQSGLVGNTEALRMLNVFVNESSLQQLAFEKGLTKTNRQLSQGERFLAIYTSILEQTSVAQGDLARTLDDPANKMRALGEAIKESATKLGITLLPLLKSLLSVVDKLIKILTILVDIFVKLPKFVQYTVFGILAFVAAIGPMLIALGFAISLLTKFVITMSLLAGYKYIAVTLGFAKISTSFAALKTTIGAFAKGPVLIAFLSTFKKITKSVIFLISQNRILATSLKVMAGFDLTTMIAAAKITGALVKRGRELENDFVDPIRKAVDNIGLFTGGLSILGDALKFVGRSFKSLYSFLTSSDSGLLKFLKRFYLLNNVITNFNKTIGAYKKAWDLVAIVVNEINKVMDTLSQKIYKADFAAQNQISVVSRLYTASQLAGRAITSLAEAEDILAAAREQHAGANAAARIAAEALSAKALTEHVKGLKAAAIAQTELSAAASMFGLRLEDLEGKLKAEVLAQYRAVQALVKAKELLAEQNKKAARAAIEALTTKDLTEYVKGLNAAAIAQRELSSAASMFGLQLEDLEGKLKAEVLAQYRAVQALAKAKELLAEQNKKAAKAAIEALSTKALTEYVKGLNAATNAQRELSAAASMFGLRIEDLEGKLKDEVLTQYRAAQALIASTKDIEDGIEKAEKQQQKFNQALQQAANIAQSLPGYFGDIGSSLLTGIGSLKALTSGGKSIFGGIQEAFKIGKGDATGFEGLIGGFSEAATQAIGAVSAGIQIGTAIIEGIQSVVLSSKLGKIMKVASVNLGAIISKELANSIRKSGQSIQLAIAEIFKSGGFKSIDRFAEEIGDIFKAFETGGFSKGSGIKALEEAIPLLIQNFDKLGVTGKRQVQRIINEARRLGFEFEGLSELITLTLTDEALEKMGFNGALNVELIRVKAIELGLEFDVLRDKILSTFAPKTMEEFAKQFGITNDKVREIGKLLEIDILTDFEKMAALLGLTTDEAKKLGEALEAKTGIPAERLAEFLEATGISAAELAESLGVELGEGSEALATAQDRANEKLAHGARLAGIMADNIQRAARMSGGIRIPGIAPNSDVLEVDNEAGNTPTPHDTTGMAKGGSGIVKGPHSFFVEPGKTEAFSFTPLNGSQQGGLNMDAIIMELKSINKQLAGQSSKTSRYVSEAISKIID